MSSCLPCRRLLAVALVLEIAARSLAIAHSVEVAPPGWRTTRILAMPPESFPAHRLIRPTACAPDLQIVAAGRMRQGLPERQTQPPEQEPERPVSSPPSVCLGS